MVESLTAPDCHKPAHKLRRKHEKEADSNSNGKAKKDRGVLARENMSRHENVALVFTVRSGYTVPSVHGFVDTVHKPI